MATIGEKLKNLRNAYGLTQSQFGSKLGISKGSINSYENNVNPLTAEAKWKIFQATGINFEYFDTDMELKEAFAKFGIDSANLKLKSLTDTVLNFYDGLEAFANNDGLKIKPITVDMNILTFLASFESSECSFIKIKGKQAQPFAKHCDILAVKKGGYPNNKQWVIAKFSNNILLAQYILSDKNEITLKSSDEYNFKFSILEFESKVKILAIIKTKISIESF